MEGDQMGTKREREIRASDLVSNFEVAQLAGKRRNTIDQWRRRHADFPVPLVDLAAGPIWDSRTISEWLAKPRLPGHHRGQIEAGPPSSPTIDLVGGTEIAKRAGVAGIQVVYMWRKRHADFPAPYVELALGSVWRWEDVATWLAKPRPPGRPRRATQDVSSPSA
jgi:predicted DNA-binding transcriptional regulator AlpA